MISLRNFLLKPYRRVLDHYNLSVSETTEELSACLYTPVHEEIELGREYSQLASQFHGALMKFSFDSTRVC